MLTKAQKDKIAELEAARDAAKAAEAAERRAANLVYWQPVLDAARDALPDWLTDGGRLEPKCASEDLEEHWVKLAQECKLYVNYNAEVDLYDADDDHVLTVVMIRKPDAWTLLETTLLRLPAADAKRQKTRAAEIQAAQEAAAASRAQFEGKVSSLMTSAEACISYADADPNRGDGWVYETLAFSTAQSLAAIARILNDLRLTAREYAERPF